MAYLPGFESDIFLSYAHVDNLTATPGGKGWVAQFHEHLEIQLWKRVGRIGSVKVWRDPALDGNQLFDKTIETHIRNSALFVALTSEGYLASEYCRRELQCFARSTQGDRYGAAIGDRLRIFNLLLNNVPHASWPEEFGRSSGFAFHDAQREDEFGEPVDPAEKLFQQQLRALVDAIYKMLSALKEAPVVEAAPTPSAVAAAADENAFTIFVAETSDSLRGTRKRLVNELNQQSGVRVITGVPPPYEPDLHEKRVLTELAAVDLSVHLLDGLAGREVDGLGGTGYPQIQADLAIAHSKSPFIWVPQTLDRDAMNDIDDDGYKEFLNRIENGSRTEHPYDFIRGSPSSIVREIQEKIEQLRTRAPEPESTPAAALLDTHFKDQLHALELSRFLLEQNIQPYINPEEDDPRKNLKLFEERLKQVTLLIVFFGNVAEEWVRARLASALQIAIAENCPLKACGVYLAPPRKMSSNIQLGQRLFPIELMDHSAGFNPASMTKLLARLKQVGTS